MSEEIGLDYEEMVENRQKENQFRNKEDEEVAQLCEDINFEVSNSDILNSTLKSTASSVSMNHSGLLRFEEEEKLPQTVERPKLRKISKIFTEEVKAVCASLSSKCSISAEKARGAVKTVCKEMYQHQYYLNADEYKNSEEMIQTNLEPPSKVPKTSKDYSDLYKYILPSSRTILKYKHRQATQEETDAGVALFNNTKPGKVTLHYDTTSRSNIDVEWPSLILNFNLKKLSFTSIIFCI